MNRETLASYSIQYDGNWDRIRLAVMNEEKPLLTEIRERYITILDEAYPDCLRQLRNPPWVLFYQGNIHLLREPMITIVGSRDLSEYGEELTVTAAKTRSGTMHTVNEALQLGRDIYTFPYPFECAEGRGCDQLINDGANILFTRGQLSEIRPKLTIC